MGCGSVSKLNDEQQEVMEGVRSKYGCECPASTSRAAIRLKSPFLAVSRRTAAAIANRFMAADEDASE